MKKMKIYNAVKIESKVEREGAVILTGYAMKFADMNGNFERYDKTAYDKFFKDYFGKNGFEMPVYFNHSKTYSDWIGNVKVLETNTVGIKVEIELKLNCPNYHAVISDIENGRLQWLSTEGWATKYKPVYKNDGFSHYLITEACITSVSLVMTPSDTNAKINIKNEMKITTNSDNQEPAENKKTGHFR